MQWDLICYAVKAQDLLLGSMNSCVHADIQSHALFIGVGGGKGVDGKEGRQIQRRWKHDFKDKIEA